MTVRMLTECTCTYEQLLKFGYKAQDIRAHHKLCKMQFKALVDWKAAHKPLNQPLNNKEKS